MIIDFFKFYNRYICMNYLVHSCMYSYYACRAAGFRLPKGLAMFITTSQICQMIMGFYVTFYSHLHDDCRMPRDVSRWGLAMYSSYFILFVNFFINAYFVGRSKPGSKDANGSSRKVKKAE